MRVSDIARAAGDKATDELWEQLHAQIVAKQNLLYDLYDAATTVANASSEERPAAERRLLELIDATLGAKP